MARLYEEVQARLTEMSLIVSRNLGMEMSRDTRVMLRPVDLRGNVALAADAGTVSPDGAVDVHCTQTSDGHLECGCYDYQTGTCGPC